jgi:hypothetical protein
MHSAMNINPESELSRRLFESSAEKKPMRLTSGDTISVLQVQAHETIPSIERRYDPTHVHQGLARSGGALRRVDVATLKKELREAREQDSSGRSA